MQEFVSNTGRAFAPSENQRRSGIHEWFLAIIDLSNADNSFLLEKHKACINHRKMQ